MTDHAETFAQILKTVRRDVDPLVKYAHMRPGDFDGEDMTHLRHPSGELLELQEWTISYAEAVAIVLDGADLFWNEDDHPSLTAGTCFASCSQKWMVGDEARVFEHAPPLTGPNRASTRCSLYTSANGVTTIHAVGEYDWPDRAL